MDIVNWVYKHQKLTLVILVSLMLSVLCIPVPLSYSLLPIFVNILIPWGVSIYELKLACVLHTVNLIFIMLSSNIIPNAYFYMLSVTPSYMIVFAFLSSFSLFIPRAMYLYYPTFELESTPQQSLLKMRIQTTRHLLDIEIPELHVYPNYKNENLTTVYTTLLQVYTGDLLHLMDDYNVSISAIDFLSLTNRLLNFVNTLKRKGVSYICSLHENKTTDFFCDESILFRVLVRLLQNSLQFTILGKIELRVFFYSEVCYIVINDTGVSIPNDERKKIFEIFYKYNNPDSNCSGMGLYFVSQDLKKVNGEICVRNKEEESGSIFEVKIPNMKSNAKDLLVT